MTPGPEWRLGTMGFGYDDWAGVFYPRDAKPGDYLSFYGKYFNAVELDTTFHATPPAEWVRRWASAVPDNFRFCAKAPKAVTHDLPLDPARAAKELTRFLDVIGGLGDKLGVILLQFPPHFFAESFDRLEALLHALPQGTPQGAPHGVRYAVELRNRTWGTRRTLDLMRSRRCCLAAAEYLTRPARLHATTDFLYVRWIGEHGRYETHDRERADMTEDLAWWKSEIERHAGDVNTVWGFFNNDYAGYSVATCNRFKQQLGLPAPAPTPADRGVLFE